MKIPQVGKEQPKEVKKTFTSKLGKFEDYIETGLLGVAALVLVGMYMTGRMGRESFGVIAGALCILVAGYYSCKALAGRIDIPKRFAFVIPLGALWAMGVLFPFYTSIYPGKLIGAGDVEKGKDGIKVQDIEAGNDYVLLASGAFSGHGGAVDGAFTVGFVAGGKDVEGADVTGKFTRSWVRKRVGRRGSTQVEVDDTSFRSPRFALPAGVTGIRLKSIDNILQEKAKLSLYKEWLPVWPYFYILQGVVLIASIGFDARFPWKKGDMPTAASALGTMLFSLAFASIVINGVSKALLGGIVAGVIGGVFGGYILVYSLKPFFKMLLPGKKK